MIILSLIVFTPFDKVNVYKPLVKLPFSNEYSLCPISELILSKNTIFPKIS